MKPAHKKLQARLERLARDWPSDVWIFAASGHLEVMEKDEEGNRVMTNVDGNVGGVDPSKILFTIDIEADGGDW